MLGKVLRAGASRGAADLQDWHLGWSLAGCWAAQPLFAHIGCHPPGLPPRLCFSSGSSGTGPSTKANPCCLTPRTRQIQKTGSSRAEHDKAGSAHGHCVDIGHFCNYLYTLYHILNVDVQGQASSTSCHKGHKYPSCQHSSGGVSVLFLINPVLQPWPCTSVQQPHGGYLAPYRCVVMLLAQPDSVMSRPAHPPVLCSPSLQSSRICSPTVFLAIAHSPAQRLTAGRAWHRLVCPLQPAAWPSQPCSQHSACSKAPGVVGQLSTEQELRVPRLPGGTGVCDSQQLQPRDLQAAAGFCLILHH